MLNSSLETTLGNKRIFCFMDFCSNRFYNSSCIYIYKLRSIRKLS